MNQRRWISVLLNLYDSYNTRENIDWRKRTFNIFGSHLVTRPRYCSQVRFYYHIARMTDFIQEVHRLVLKWTFTSDMDKAFCKSYMFDRKVTNKFFTLINVKMQTWSIRSNRNQIFVKKPQSRCFTDWMLTWDYILQKW